MVNFVEISTWLRNAGSWFQKTEDLDPQVSLGAEKNKFAFQGPAAPQMMEVLSNLVSIRKGWKNPKEVGETKGFGPLTNGIFHGNLGNPICNCLGGLG